MFIVSDDILERLICSQCKKYLSVKNVKVYPNRGIKCGRCSSNSDAGVVSLFGVLAEEALFRCVNRFEGCNELLTYSSVAEHERSCIGKEYECPCCIKSFKGTGYEIYVHFKEQHADRLLINNAEFILEIDSELDKSFLYRKNDLLFYVNARYFRAEEELILSVTYIGIGCNASKITQQFFLYSLDGKLKDKTTRKSCCSVTEGYSKSFKMRISTKNFSKNIVICRFDLETEKVESFVMLPGKPKRIKTEKADSDNNRADTFNFGSSFNAATTSSGTWGLNSFKDIKLPATTSAPNIFNPIELSRVTAIPAFGKPVTTTTSGLSLSSIQWPPALGGTVTTTSTVTRPSTTTKLTGSNTFSWTPNPSTVQPLATLNQTGFIPAPINKNSDSFRIPRTTRN